MTCEITEDPFSIKNPCDAPSDEQKRDYAITLARSDAITRDIAQSSSTAYLWDATDAYTNAKAANPESDDGDATPNPVMENLDSDSLNDTYLVCFCDSKGTGWRWEVHIDSRQALYIDNDPDLKKRYGITTPS